jgi:hypothetical protein
LRLTPLALTVALLLSGTAHAAVCEGYGDLSSVAPAFGEVHAPSNTRIWVGEAWTDTADHLEVRTAIAPFVSVPIDHVTRIVAGRDEVSILHMAEPLPHNAYKIFVIDQSGAEYDLGAFATDDDPDTTPPEVPGSDGFEPVWETGEVPGCGLFADGRLYVPSTAPILVLDIRDEDDAVPDGDDDDSAGGLPLFFDADALEGTVDGILFADYYPEWFEIGNTPCLQNWPLAVEGAITEIRFGALDLAGNFSGWGPWHELTVPRTLGEDPAGQGPPPEEEEEGCSFAPVRSRARGLPTALALVALYAVRRRWQTPAP